MDRAPEPKAHDEVGLLLGWLRFHRDALAAKCEGMTDEQLLVQSAPPSALSLLGLVRHLTEMERVYAVNALSGENKGLHYCTEHNPDGDIEGLDLTMVGASMSTWHAEMAAADRLLEAVTDLSAPAPTGRPVRWYVAKLMQEYARHNGHADIIRERIDGSRGE